MTHVPHKCDREDCFTCNGGLTVCVICKGAEASLPQHCPGAAMTPEQQDAVQAGELEYYKGKWWQRSSSKNATTLTDVQKRVNTWLHACMGPAIANNLEERYLRVAEEFAELMSACDAPRDTVIQIIRDVYDKEQMSIPTKKGFVSEECADLLICLAALATTHGVSLQTEIHRILDRNWENIEKIRGKHSQKKFKSAEAIQEGTNGK